MSSQGSLRQLRVPVDSVDDDLDLLISDEYIEAVFTVKLKLMLSGLGSSQL